MVLYRKFYQQKKVASRRGEMKGKDMKKKMDKATLKNGGRGRESNPPIPFKGDNRY